MDKIIFVYNAQAGYFNGLADAAHKLFSPTTYPCSLCGLTYGTFKIRPEWQAFVQQSPLPFLFLHKEAFYLQYPDWIETPLPVVLLQSATAIKVLLDKQQLDGFKTIGELKDSILEQLKG